MALLVASGLAAQPGRADEVDDLALAQRLLLTGRYAEAAERWAELEDKHPVEAALGIAVCHREQGKLDEAEKTLLAARENESAAALDAALAELAFERGRYDDAQKRAAAALELDENNLRARWVQAELLRVRGKLDEADKAYGWFVDYYNAAARIDDPDELRYIGLAAARFARWNRLSDQFSFLVNELFPDALAVEENYWPAHYEAGRLFLEKYNDAEATRSLKAALAINPNSADIHAALAELAIQNYDLDTAQREIRQALAICPAHPAATMMRADAHLANFDYLSAANVLEGALKLNPVSEPLLGRLAATYGMIDGLQDDPAGTRMGGIIAEATERNPHCGEFYFALAQALDKGRQFPAAAKFFQEAVRVMPQLVGPRGQLALMHMRLGEEEAARRVLEESFDIDPFNVRVINSIKVLEVLDGYKTIETDHFIFRFDAKKDELLVEYMARYLEEIYPELCRRLDFEPPDKSLFEVFNQARNTNGHGWFSARMVGLPNVHTIGACAGKMVALTSPSSLPQKFNWARVLKHEFVHVINLQQTNYNIPHWFTEALAVLLEENPRPAEWNEMLARRVPAGEVFNLDTINLGFIRPASSEDWQMAYCQAEVYAEYMVQQFGEASLGRMLAAYRDNLNTEAAIERALGVKQAEFEKGYTEHLNELVASLAASKTTGAADRSFSDLQKAHAASPKDDETAAQLALAYLLRKAFPQAGKLADAVLARSPKHQLATYVKARLLLVIGQAREALDMLEAALDREQPQIETLRLLAGLKFKAGDLAAAEELYALAAEKHPGDLDWVKSLAMVYLKSGEDEKLVKALTRLAEADTEELVVRKKLAQLAFAAGDHAAAARWANQCIQIDVQDATAHRILGESSLALGDEALAVRELEVVLRLDPDNAEVQAILEKIRP